ncbi:histone-lysine N-methyltransferase, H3 lysine-9 specific SUVH4 isoform X1, partial [Tanacetum coccineum]
MSTEQFSQSTTDDVVTDGKRRTSSRVPEGKRPYYGPVALPPAINKNKNTNTKKIKITSTKTSTNVVSTTDNTTIISQQQQQPSISSISARFLYVPHSADDIAKVKITLGIYNKHYLGYIQDEDIAAKKREDKKKKNGGADKKQVDRPDLYATAETLYLMLMRKSRQILYPERRIGHLPGIDVGHQFCSRAEMVAVGLHCHWLNGIDSMGKNYRKKVKEENDGILGSKHQYKNQELKLGNLALKNSMDQSIPVRFIRGHPSKDKGLNKKKKEGFKLFTYDGLYKVVDCRFDVGKSGFSVYKFSLKRLEGQPKLKSNKVEYKHGRSSNVAVKSPTSDLAEGQEKLRIPVINSIDDATITGKFVEFCITASYLIICSRSSGSSVFLHFDLKVATSGFTYTNSLQVPSSLELPPNADGCNCKENCTNPKTCACAKLNGGDFPYVKNCGGRLIEAKDVVFECGPNCGCGPGCINRVSQRKIEYQLEVFRTSDRGWAVKTRDFIPSGAPVCEYIGNLQRTSEMDKVTSNEYIFEIDCEQTIKGIGGRERRLGAGSVKSENVAVDEKESEPEFCIDAGSIGNVARFINHSCDPNLFVQCVVSSHHELKLARIVLVAAENIPPKKELTYDYGYALNSVVDENNMVKTLTCHLKWMALERLSLVVHESAEEEQNSNSKAPRLPRWTRQELLVLIQGKRVAENRVRRGRSAVMAFGASSAQVEPKWSSVSSYCKRHGVNRGPVQCRKRWSNLAGDFKKIKEWESQISSKKEVESFWVMRNDLRRERKLPGFFDREVYDILDGGGGSSSSAAAAGEEAEGDRSLVLSLAPTSAANDNDDQEEAEETDKEVLFDSGRTAASDDGLFSDEPIIPSSPFGKLDKEQQPAPTPISATQYVPFSQPGVPTTDDAAAAGNLLE